MVGFYTAALGATPCSYSPIEITDSDYTKSKTAGFPQHEVLEFFSLADVIKLHVFYRFSLTRFIKIAIF